MKKKNIIILIFLLVIGYAAVSTSLTINARATIGKNENDFRVVFTQVLIDGEKSDKAIISEDKQRITFLYDKLTSVGDESELEYAVKNNSTQYGANVTITCTNNMTDNVLTVNEFDGKILSKLVPVEIEAQETKTGKLNVKLIKTYEGIDDSAVITCILDSVPIEKEEKVDYVPDSGLIVKYKENMLNGADPVLKLGLIPVNIASDGTVTYADINKKWYSYENKEWANAVILEGGSNYKVGEVIKENDIESYFVWVPRYKYQIFDEGYYSEDEQSSSKPFASIAKEIQIQFEGKDVNPSKGITKGSWLTHPAFTNFDVNGLWVGKFETGYKGAASEIAAGVDENDSSKVIIKPNVYSWRHCSVANMFKSAYHYKRLLDSHMMKNTEWGAVAYLSHSRYGINTEVRINNNSNLLTGYAAVDGTNQNRNDNDDRGTYGTDPSITLPYNTPTGYKASTTGNITGIYDMSGGSQECMASYMEGHGESSFGIVSKVYSGFVAADLVLFNDYLDKYPLISKQDSYDNRFLGDATGEMGPFYAHVGNWYDDSSNFLEKNFPWFSRGGLYRHGIRAGQFNFSGYDGHTNSSGLHSDVSFRIVLAP